MKEFVVLVILSLAVLACQPLGQTPGKTGKPGRSGNTTRVEEQEGVINGGGGKGVLCKKSGQDWLRVLDLYEAQEQKQMILLEEPKSMEEAIDLAAEKIQRHFWNPETIEPNAHLSEIRATLKKYLASMKFLKPGKKLKLVNDSYEVVTDGDCRPAQIAVYFDEIDLLVDPGLWKKLSYLNRIALLVHEIVYKMDRENGATNSLLVRKLVGSLFSKPGIRPIYDGVPIEQNKVLRCTFSSSTSTEAGYAYAFETVVSGKPGIEFVFSILQSKPLLRTSTFIQDRELTLERLMTTTNVQMRSPLFVDTYPSTRFIVWEIQGSGRASLTLLSEKDLASGLGLKMQCAKP